jgi:hypothetical protein
VTSLFDSIPLNPTVAPESAPRLSRQCLRILDRLRRGRASNGELAEIGLKYTGRISEIRQAGFDVRVVSHDKTTGVAHYALFTDGKEVTA